MFADINNGQNLTCFVSAVRLEFLMNVASAGRLPAIHDNTVSSESQHQPVKITLVHLYTPTGKLLREKPFQDFDALSQQIEQCTVYHHQSELYREGTVHSQRACYFHEPFNVASKDICIIHHSEASQKTPFVFCFSPPLTLRQKPNKSLFFSV